MLYPSDLLSSPYHFVLKIMKEDKTLKESHSLWVAWQGFRAGCQSGHMQKLLLVPAKGCWSGALSPLSPSHALPRSSLNWDPGASNHQPTSVSANFPHCWHLHKTVRLEVAWRPGPVYEAKNLCFIYYHGGRNFIGPQYRFSVGWCRGLARNFIGQKNGHIIPKNEWVISTGSPLLLFLFLSDLLSSFFISKNNGMNYSLFCLTSWPIYHTHTHTLWQDSPNAFLSIYLGWI